MKFTKQLSFMTGISAYSYFCKTFLMLWFIMELVSYVFFLYVFSSKLKSNRDSMMTFFLIMGFSSVLTLFLFVGIEMNLFEGGGFKYVKECVVCLGISLKFGLFPGNFWISKVASRFNTYELVCFNTILKLPSIIFFSIVLKDSLLIFSLLYTLCSFSLILGLFMKDENTLMTYASLGSTFFLMYLYNVNPGLFILFFLFYSISFAAIFLSESGLMKVFFMSVFLGLPLGPYFFFKMYLFWSLGGVGYILFLSCLFVVFFSLPIYYRVFCSFSKNLDFNKNFYKISKMDIFFIFLMLLSGLMVFVIYFF